MSRYRPPTRRFFEQYPGINARTTDTWTTRYYNRKHDPLFKLLGLNTAPDDFNKRDGSSPYLRNVRYMGEREGDQRAQVMSRRGAGFIGTLGEDSLPNTEVQGQTYLEFREGHVLQWVSTHNKILTGVSFYFANQDQASGFIKISVRDFDTQVELANSVVDLQTVNMRGGYSHHITRFITPVFSSRVRVRLEILDDVDNSNSTPHPVRVLAQTNGTHEYADYELPNVNDALQEIPYIFVEAPTIPMMGTLINDWQPMVRSKDFVSGGERYIAFPVRHDGMVEIYKTNLVTNVTSLLTDYVSDNALVVRFERVEGYLYYIDGISPLRRINLTTFVAEDAVPLVGDIQVAGVTPASLTAKPGASLIHFAQNHLYLSGFKDDPNLVIVSLIDAVKPRFDQYKDKFYSPDQSPELSAGSPITALADVSGYVIVWRTDGLSLFSIADGFDAGDISQATPEGAQLGVLNQEAVCQGKNNIFFYNPVEGVQRFGGSLNVDVGNDIENIFSQIRHPESVFMLYQKKRVRMYFSLTETTPDSCLYYYTENTQGLPWYYDKNTPVSSAIALSDSERIIAIHSKVPAVMDVDTQFTDFDSYIEMEYSTQYRVTSTSSPDGWVYVRRLHIHELANSTHSIYIGLDIDHQDKPIVWRRFVDATVDDATNPDAIFEHSTEAGNAVIDIDMYVKCRRYQVRLKRYCYKDTAEVLGIDVEYGDKDAI